VRKDPTTAHNAGAIPAAERRAALNAEAEQLRRKRGAALLDGRKFDEAPLRAVTDALDALDDVESESIRRRAAAAAATDAERKQHARALIADADSTRRTALGLAERAARAMVAEMATVIAAAQEIARLAAEMGATPPLGLARPEVETRLSRALAALLAPPPTWQFGVLEWGSLPDAPGDWVAADAAATARHIDALTKE
jgi:hypothetical protein